MAKPSARNAKTGSPTASSSRPTRTPVKSAVASKVTGETATSSRRRRGRPASTVGKKTGDDKTPGKKKKKRVVSVQTLMKRQREATKARRSLVSDENEKNTRKANGKGPKPEDVFNDEMNSTGLEWEAEKVIDSKLKGADRFYLIKWAGYDDSENTWEPEVHLRNADQLIADSDEAFPDKP